MISRINSMHFRPQVTRFVILFVERTGSTYLSTLLNSHPDINALREQLAVLRQQGKSGQDQVDWTRTFFTPPLIGQYASLGFKTKIVDILDPEAFIDVLQENQTHIIQLQRRNSVKGVVSTLNARRLREASGNWNLLKEDDRLPVFAIDPAEFDDYLSRRKGWDRELEVFVAQLQLPTLQVFYEDMLRDEDQFLQGIFDFLGVKSKPVAGKTLKNTSDDLRDAILNFDELRANYLNTPYEALFDEIVVQPAS